MAERKLELIYRGSVKDLLSDGEGRLVFDYSDAYSVFDWGRMPDALPRKGEALAVLASDLFERLERPETWKEFSRSAEAHELRKANRFGASFNEMGEALQSQGLRTHYVGLSADGPSVDPQPLARVKAAGRRMVVRPVSAVKPRMTTVLGRSIPDYTATRKAPAPRLVPLEVVFRFAVPAGSSLIERVAQDPSYLPSRGYPDVKVHEGARWGFPVLELFTKLETSDRPLSLTEALAISGLEGEQLQRLLLKTAWVAGYLKALCAKTGLELADGKLEWGLGSDGEPFLVDAIGPDELRILKDGVQLSKEFLRGYYRGTPWYEALNQAKKQAQSQGSSDWKRLVNTPVPPLPAKSRELATQLYLALTNHLTGRSWFPEAWSLDRVVEGLKGVHE